MTTARLCSFGGCSVDDVTLRVGAALLGVLVFFVVLYVVLNSGPPHDDPNGYAT